MFDVILIIILLMLFCNNLIFYITLFFGIFFMKRNDSPCINLCKFSGKKEWCLGCGRTRQECREWKVMKTYKRILLNKKLLRRMLQISNNT